MIWLKLIKVSLGLMIGLFIGLTPTDRMAEANQAYEQGNFEKAITLYEALHHDGFRHSYLYYNMANAYYQQEDWGKAILNYRRAQALAPRDADIRTNLALARSRTQDELSETPEALIPILAYLTERWLTLGEVQGLALGVWLLGCVSFSLSLVWARWASLGRGGLGIAVALLALLIISGTSRLYREWRYPAAVLVAPTVEVTSGPGASDRYPKQFILHAGTDARILEQQGGWVHLTFPNNLEGWVSVQHVAAVNE